MIKLVYSSTATRVMSDNDLLNLADQSAARNLELDITGILLYQDGTFLQVLEGPDHEVWELYKTIRQDSRHIAIQTLTTEPILSRSFPQWSMGFNNLNGVDVTKIPGYVDLFGDGTVDLEMSVHPNALDELIGYFQGIMVSP